MPGDAISICPSRKPRLTPGPALFCNVLRVIRIGKVTPIAEHCETKSKTLETKRLGNKRTKRHCRVHDHVSGMCALPQLEHLHVFSLSPCPSCRCEPALGRIIRRNCGGCHAVGRGRTVGGAPYCRA